MGKSIRPRWVNIKLSFYRRVYVIDMILPGQWVAIGLEWDYSNKKIKFFVNGAVTEISGGPKNIAIGLPGTIRLGYTLPSSSSPAALTGRVTCFVIRSGFYNYGSLKTDVQDCLSSNWALTTGKEQCQQGATQDVISGLFSIS